MSTVIDAIAQWKNLNIADIANDVIFENEKAIIDKNRDQLAHGLNADGKHIGKYRNKNYAALKQRMNPLPPYGVPDLIYTGAFTEAFKLDVVGQNLIIYSTDNKAEILEKKYKNIYGLDDISAQELEQETITPAIIEAIKKYVGL